ncbi:MAG: lipoyl synthase [Desulfobacterales bacterium]|nr:lipoyl synthase [Desulfobacterales bacterium]MCP4162729.1 lipoyl synthase [Deltaproteobacteria bacterium]
MKIRKKQKPEWLKRTLPTGPEYERMKKLLSGNNLNTVCQEAKCPNQFECFSKGTSTFMIMGEKCTRNCNFCAVQNNPIDLPDLKEPKRVSKTVEKMNLSYVVITSVTRDDLEDGGASFFAETIREIKKLNKDILVEVLIPDFQGNKKALKTVLDAKPDVLNHNIETVPSLYHRVRPEAIYERSLDLIKRSKAYAPGIPTKSGLMVGLGEKKEDLIQTFQDLVEHGCDALTIGQYLQPSKDHLPVEQFVTPEDFENLREIALEKGFIEVASGPFVRSSYQAASLFEKVNNCSQHIEHNQI